MKSELKESTENRPRRQYPCLLRFKPLGYIILATGEEVDRDGDTYGAGVVVHSEDGSFELGYGLHDNTGFTYLDGSGKGDWEEVDEIVELSNG